MKPGEAERLGGARLRGGGGGGQCMCWLRAGPQPPTHAQPPPVDVAVSAAAEATLPARLRAEQIPLLEPLAVARGSPGLGVLQAVTGHGAASSSFKLFALLLATLVLFIRLLVSSGRPFPAGGQSPAPCRPSAPREAPPVAASAEPSAADPGPHGDQGAG
uniref:Uncharacterized protein n=1 Tax=Myotis myotis TaxID=51298 RepID=A0A7J7R1B5_MYOMY|nr:hypothetical protein mMyoMyo1_011219 [Myotis myotis]